MKYKSPKAFLCMFICSALILLTNVPLYALTFTWGGAPISGEAGEEYPNFFPEGSATFDINADDSLLFLTLTYTGYSEPLSSKNQVLTGLTWDLLNYGGQLNAVSAVIADGSSLILDPGSFIDTDLSGQWAYKDDIIAPLAPIGPLGQYGVGAVGDINFGEDTFGTDSIIDSNKTQYTPSPNGIDFGIVPNGDESLYDPFINPGVKGLGPVVQNSMFFTFSFTDGLDPEMFTNVQPLFGTDGAPPVPEPTTMLLFGTGLIGLVGFRKKLKKQ